MLYKIAEMLGLFNKHDAEIKKLKEELEELRKKKETAEQQLKDLIEERVLDVQELQQWYDNRFGDDKWYFPYDGRLAKDVKHALEVEDISVIDSLCENITKVMNFKDEEPAQIIEAVMRYFLSKWTYISDIEYYNKSEYWAPADVSAVTLKGDCDDLAILMHIVIRNLFDRYGLEDYKWRLKITGGLVAGEGGHAFNIWLHDDGEWYAVESTYYLKESLARTWLKTPIKNNNLYRVFWGFARPDRSWKGYNLNSLESIENG